MEVAINGVEVSIKGSIFETFNLLALSFGVASIGLAYMCKYLGNTVLQLALSIFGILGGPLLAVISMGFVRFIFS